MHRGPQRALRRCWVCAAVVLGSSKGPTSGKAHQDQADVKSLGALDVLMEAEDAESGDRENHSEFP